MKLSPLLTSSSNHKTVFTFCRGGKRALASVLCLIIQTTDINDIPR